MTTKNIQQLTLLRIAYKVFDATKHSRTFFILGRTHLIDAFSFRGFYAAYKIQGYDFMENHLTNPESDKNAVTLYGEDKLQAFLEACDLEIKEDTEMTTLCQKLIKEDNGDTGEAVKAQVKEALQEMNAEVTTQAEQLKNVASAASSASKAVSEAAEAIEKTSQANTKAVNPGYGLSLDINAVFTSAAKDFLTGEKQGILSYVTDKIKSAALSNTLILLPGMNGKTEVKTIVSGRLHKDFKEVLEVTLLEKQSFLGGPAGSGKTTLGAQVAEALALPFGHISCSAGMSEAHLLGRMIADGTYISSRFVELYEEGGVFLADEIDAADANTLLILNSALANGYISVPNRAGNPTAKRHKDFYLLAAANTFGNGSAEYAGREILDAAFMDRFAGSKIFIDYDIDLEAEICKAYDAVARRIWKIRDNVKSNRIRRIVSTRVFAAAVRNMTAGRSEKQFFERFFTGWSDEEIKKACA